MRLLLDEEKLNMLLAAHKPDLYVTKSAQYLNLGEQFLFAFSVYMGTFPYVAVQYVMGLAIIIAIVWSIKRLMKSKDYSIEQLQKDIKGLSEITHPYSLVVIKDTFNKYPNRYLVYYDKKWQCKFFLNYKTASKNDEEVLKQRLSNELKVSPDIIFIEKRAERIQKKFHPTEEINKTYDHTLYYVTLDTIPAEYQTSTFSIEGKDFYWLTMATMEQDKEIQEKNMDVVAFVREMIA